MGIEKLSRIFFPEADGFEIEGKHDLPTNLIPYRSRFSLWEDADYCRIEIVPFIHDRTLAFTLTLTVVVFIFFVLLFMFVDVNRPDEAIRKRKLENQRAQLTDYAKDLAADIKKGKLTSKDAIDKFFNKAKDLTGNNTASALLIATGSALDLRSSANLEGTRQNIGSRITEGSLGQDTLHHFFINAFNNYENPLLGGVITAVATRQETDPEDRFADRQGARFGELLAEPHGIDPSLKEKYKVESPDGFRYTYYRDPLRPSFVIP